VVIRQRAIQAEDKQERHHSILDAAERMLLRSPDRVPNVAEVADEAGLAKGTVYLYFPGKEELLLALHERNLGGFFEATFALLERAQPVDIEDVLVVTHRHMIDAPLFLPLAARCLAQMGQSVPAEAALAFKQRLGERLARAGAGLEHHFRQLQSGGGVLLLRHSYALILGLWQLTGSEVCVMPGEPGPGDPRASTYSENIDAALRALWLGTVGIGAANLRSAS
jgi:AcrR family transcriptional regulator